MASTDSVSSVSAAVNAYVNKIYDIRDVNQDGKVSAIEQQVYDEKHTKTATAIPSVETASESASSGNASSGKGVNVSA